MIIQYLCKNFGSIGDTIKLNMLATNDTTLKENCLIYNDKVHILKESVIYGANGSGKTTIIKSLSFLRLLILNSHRHNPGDDINTFKNKLNIDKDTEYLIHFIYNNIRYLYGLSYNSKEISEEFLYYFPNDKKTKVFDIKKDDVSYGETFKKDLSLVEKDYLKPNRLLLSCAADRKNIKEIVDTYLFFNKQLVIYDNQISWDIYSTTTASKDEKINKLFVDFMHLVGKNNLKNISSKLEEIKINSNQIPQVFNSEFRNYLQDNIYKTPIIKFDYGDYILDIKEESSGIQKLFTMFFPFVDIINNNKIFICDEFETHLHPLIVRELLEMFKNNAKRAQIIFTTHDINLLDLKIFRRDQIWFTEQKENGYTDLYSLSDLKNVRKDEKISKNYILGKYSGVPMINEDVKKRFLKELEDYDDK